MKIITVSLSLAVAAFMGGTFQKCKADSNPPPALSDLTQYANPICGTGTAPAPHGVNNTYPGATMPFGMIQWSPDTETGRHVSGYYIKDKRISDFSVDHISGAGCPYGGDFAMMPIAGPQPIHPPTDRRAFAQAFSHAKETARPGYYGVTFTNGMKAELTATTRTGFGRFTYLKHQPETMMINAASDINGPSASGININPDRREISGWCIGGHFCATPEVRTIYFYAVFDHPFKTWSTWTDKVLTPGATNGSGTTSGAFITFKDSRNQTVMAKVGISYVSVDNARANVEAENPSSAFTSRDFDKAVRTARG